MSVEVTDKSGNPLGDVHVGVAGPAERSGITARDGSVTFRSMRPGTYRLRFEREEYTTLEREVVMRAGQAGSVSVALTAAPFKPLAPIVRQAPPPLSVRSGSRVVEPRGFSITDFLETNLIGSEPLKTTLIGCAEGGTARLVQVRDPLNKQQNADADEILYVVAGSGILRIRDRDFKAGPGFFALVPRGMPYSIRRDGRNPVIALAVQTGAPCIDAAAQGR